MLNPETGIPQPAFGTFSHLVRLRVEQAELHHVTEDMIQMAGVFLKNESGILAADSPRERDIYWVGAKVLADAVTSLAGRELKELVNVAHQPNPALDSIEILMNQAIERLQREPFIEELEINAQIGRYEALQDPPFPRL
jgi:hypothetical protein